MDNKNSQNKTFPAPSSNVESNKSGQDQEKTFFEPENPIWLSVSESAKIGGVQSKTIRRAIQSSLVKYKIVGNRYFIELSTVFKFLLSKTKLKNKFIKFGLGQYLEQFFKKDKE